MPKTLYILLAFICSVLALVPFGYAIIHGGEYFLLIAPAVFIIFMLPFAVQRIKSAPAFVKKGAFILPVMAFVLPIVFIFAIRPYLEGARYKQLLAQVTITGIKESHNAELAPLLLGLNIEYEMQVPVALHVPLDALDYSPISFPEAEIVANPNNLMSRANIKIWRNGVPFENTFTGFPAGQYRVSVDFTVSNIRKAASTNSFCRTGEVLPFAGSKHMTSRTQPELKISSRINLSNRMGIFYFDLHQGPLNTYFDFAEMETTWRSLPLCS